MGALGKLFGEDVTCAWSRKKISGDSEEERKEKTVLLSAMHHVQSPSELWIIPHNALRKGLCSHSVDEETEAESQL